MSHKSDSPGAMDGEEPREITARWPGSCFACSNPNGLQLKFWRTQEGAVSRCSIPAGYCGFDGLVHGGIIATMLDEISCWAIFARLGKLGVTRDMMTRFHKPVRTETGLILAADIVSSDPRSALVRATVRDADNTLLAEGESNWAFPRLSRIAGLAGAEESVLQQFLDECCADTQSLPNII